jgi:hypothetical protein
MKELLRTTDAVLLSFINSLLSDAGIQFMVADVHISSLELSIAVFPRRVLVPAEDWEESREILIAAGLGEHLDATGLAGKRANPA